jgi:hypothetical protein
MLAMGTPVVPTERFEQEDRGLAVERLRFNLLANSSLVSGAATACLP